MPKRIALLLLLAAPVQAEIDPKAIKAHIDFLAHDLFEGREAGTRGYDLAAAYVATQMAAAGLEPGGSDGSWFQPVRLRSSLLLTDTTRFCIGESARCQPFEHRKDVMLSSDFFQERSELTAELVLAGFGVVAPELGHDDYAGLDVRGKVVVMLSGAPPRFPHSERAYHSSGTVKAQSAVARGAIGILGVRTLELERRVPWQRFTTLSAPTSMRTLQGDVPLEAFPELRLSATLGRAAAEAAWRSAPISLEQVLADADKGVTHRFPLRTQVASLVSTRLGTAQSANVVGILRGSDPILAAEQVVMSAHLDHLGLAEAAPEVGGQADRIRNGALDNASGIAALLEIARSLRAAGRAPARSIVFLAVTAEEKGLQGSLAFVEQGGVARDKLVANINMDMIQMLFPLKSLIALGSGHSSLLPLVQAAAASAGFDLVPELEPEEAFFIRSDQFSFVKRGIPAISLRAAPSSSDASIDALAVMRNWTRTIYHSVRDEPGQAIDYASGARWARANMSLAVAIANAPQRPRWNPGDFFGRRFGTPLTAAPGDASNSAP